MLHLFVLARESVRPFEMINVCQPFFLDIPLMLLPMIQTKILSHDDFRVSSLPLTGNDEVVSMGLSAGVDLNGQKINKEANVSSASLT